MRMRHHGVWPLLLVLAACKPPASDEYVERTRLPERRDAPAMPLASPGTDGAIWAPATGGARLLYGKPGERPLFALECVEAKVPPAISFTRYAPADAHAKAVLALIGNGHVKRLKIDAVRVGEAWLWRGELAANDPAWDVMTGAREIEATVPGAGSLKLNPSPLPGQLVEQCRAPASIQPPESFPAVLATPAGPG